VKKSALVLAGLGLSAFYSVAAFAQEGYPDPTFGNAGSGVTTFASAAFAYPRDTAVLADGRILTLSSILQNTQTNETYVGIARFTADGTIDTSFSFDGKVLADFGGDNTYNDVEAMIVQTDGKILVCGASVFSGGGDHTEFAVLRLNTDGTLDPSFGGTGKVHVAFDDATNTNVAFCKAIALQTDGKIVLAGYALRSAGGLNYDFAATRLNPNGTLDTGFGAGGKRYVAFDFAGSVDDDEVRAVAIDASGNILLAGIADHGTGGTRNNDMAIAKLDPNGNLDPNFNTDGKASVAFNRGGTNDDEALEVLVQHDGRILLVGSAIGNATALNYDFAVVRLFPDGSPDTGYGPNGNGRLRVPFDVYTDGTDICFSGLLLSDGKLLLSGLAALSPTYTVYGFARLLPKGTLDAGFGTGGQIHYGATALATNYGIAMHPRSQGGRVVAAIGNYTSPSTHNTNVGVTRLQTDLIFIDGFE
jgi:uncharacterized delta-60 repeat protein